MTPSRMPDDSFSAISRFFRPAHFMVTSRSRRIAGGNPQSLDGRSLAAGCREGLGDRRMA
jgi:hypothetical protein